MAETIAALTAAFAAGTRSPEAEIETYAARIAEARALNCFQHLDLPRAQAEAAASTRRWRAGAPLGPLDGVALAVKDTLAVAGMPTRHGSLTTGATPAVRDAPAVALLREAGAIVLGKTATPEFAWKAMTDSALGGVTRNPWDLTRTPGGSTGGGAAALAAGLCAAALGTDAGGSIRIPAAWCGLIGVKPTQGRIAQPHGGLFGDLSTVAVLVRAADDAALLLAVLTRTAEPPPSLRGRRVAFVPVLAEAEPDAEAVAAARGALGPLERAGMAVREIDAPVPPLEPAFRAYWSAALAAKLHGLDEAHRARVDPGLAAAAAEGACVSREALLDAHASRLDLRESLARAFASFDLLATPTTPGPAPLADTALPDRWRHLTPFTYPFNLTGQPAVSVPAGRHSCGVPLGVQLVGAHGGDALLLAAARTITGG